MSSSSACVSLALCVLAPIAAASGVRIVTPEGDSSFPDIQSAVDAAVDGDALLVGEGEYGPFTVDGKALSIFAVPGGEVVVNDTITVRNLAPGQVLVLSGIAVEVAWGDGWSSNYHPSVVLEDNEGYVRLQDAHFGRVAPGPDIDSFCDIVPVRDGAIGIAVYRSPRVALLHCAVAGGPGENVNDDYVSCPGGTGGPGLELHGSTVALYECEVIGGFGGATGYYGTGRGGTSLVAYDSDVFTSGGYLRGGYGGLGLDTVGPMGYGVWLSERSRLRTMDCPILSSSGEVTGPGVFDPLSGSARTVEAATVVSSADALTVRFLGLPGDVVWLPTSLDCGHLFLAAANGVWLTAFPPSSVGRAFGVVDRSGEVNVDLGPYALPPGAAHATRTVQGLAVTYLRQRATPGAAVQDHFLSSALHVLTLDPDLGPDCNGNGISDYLDVVQGTSPDVDHDVVPDECQP